MQVKKVFVTIELDTADGSTGQFIKSFTSASEAINWIKSYEQN